MKKPTLILGIILILLYMFAGGDNKILYILKSPFGIVVYLLFSVSIFLGIFKGRFGIYRLPSIFLRVGVALFMIAFLISVHIRDTKEVLAIEGRKSILYGKEIFFKKIDVDVPDEFFEVGEASFTLKKAILEAEIDGKNLYIDPVVPLRDGLSYYRVVGVGLLGNLPYGNDYIESPLEVFPPGRRSEVRLPGGERLTINLLPEKEFKKGLLSGKLYNLKKITYYAVFKGEDGRIIKEGKLEGDRRFFLNLLVIKDPAILFIYEGIFLIIFGIIIYPLRFLSPKP